MNFLRMNLAGLSALFLAAAPLRADLIYFLDDDGPFLGPNQVTSSSWNAQTFSTGTQAMTLNSIAVKIRNESGSPASINLNLYAVDAFKKPTGSSLLPSPATTVCPLGIITAVRATTRRSRQPSASRPIPLTPWLCPLLPARPVGSPTMMGFRSLRPLSRRPLSTVGAALTPDLYGARFLSVVPIPWALT